MTYDLFKMLGNTTVMITGGGGLLGRCLAERLALSGRRVVSVPHSHLDVTDEADVRRRVETEQPRVVINCAATTDVDRCETEPEWAHQVNVEGPRYLARAARLTGAEIVHIGTDYVFDGEKEGFYTQDDEPRPLSVYGRTKLGGEAAVLEESERVYLVRSSWIFGRGGKNFGSRVIEYARSGATLKGVTDQTSIPTYGPDLARRIDEILRRGVHGLYHVTNTGPGTWFEFARLALDLAGMPEVEVQPVTRAELNQAAARPRNSAMRCLLSERLGFAPLRPWRDALAELIAEAR